MTTIEISEYLALGAIKIFNPEMGVFTHQDHERFKQLKRKLEQKKSKKL